MTSLRLSSYLLFSKTNQVRLLQVPIQIRANMCKMEGKWVKKKKWKPIKSEKIIEKTEHWKKPD
jgi:hypothetical protein